MRRVPLAAYPRPPVLRSPRYSRPRCRYRSSRLAIKGYERGAVSGGRRCAKTRRPCTSEHAVVITTNAWRVARDDPPRHRACWGAGLTEGDLLLVSKRVEEAPSSALTLLSLTGLAAAKGGRWRVREGAVLRSRA